MIDYSIHTLDNGLRVVHHYDASTGHVALNTLYDVGARDENPRLTGMAHLFEHLMFGGSVNVPDFDGAVEMAGGTNNAWTSNDFTNFYTILPACNVETGLWVESDRMLSLAFSEESLEVQRRVVMEEFKQVCLNRPYGDLGHRLRELLYTSHPYRYPTIGKELSHLERVSMHDVKNFFYSHYAPNNAVLAIAGPIEENRALELVHKWYDSIPRREIAPRKCVEEAPPTSPRRLVVEADVPQTRIIIATLMAPASSPDYRVADIITDILASGQSARFNRRLVMGTDLFTAADASISGSRDQGFIMANGALRNDSDEAIARAESHLWAEMRDLAETEVTPRELERAINRFESNLTFSLINYLSKATQLARAVMTSEDINLTPALYRAITTADVKRVAAHLFQPHRMVTLIYRPRR